MFIEKIKGNKMYKDFLPIIIGTDINSYTVAYSIYDEYKIKPIVCGSAVLIPFYKTKIAKVYTRENFSTDSNVLVELLNEVYKENAKNNQKVIFFFPVERYLHILYNNLEKLKFDFEIPYPKQDLAFLAANKTMFYKKMEEINVNIPITKSVNKFNYKNELDDFNDNQELFMKAEIYENLEDAGIKNFKKGYYIKNKDEALKELEYIYDKNNYNGNFIIQTFINGEEGTEFSINGYRSNSGKITMVQSQSLLSDPRPTWIGNHLVLIDNNDERLYKIAENIVEKLDYYGVFNFDFKIDSKTGEIFVLECNPRQGRSFYYANLGGVNFMKQAIEDRIYGRDVEQKQTKKFNWIVASDEINRKAIDNSLLNEYLDKDRQNNMVRVLENEYDNTLLRKAKLNKYQNDLDEMYLTLFK